MNIHSSREKVDEGHNCINKKISGAVVQPL
jgi:hypothetical protein